MNLQYENLRIRNATEKDAKVLCKWWNDGKVMAHAGFPNGLSVSEESVIRDLLKDDDNHRRLIIELDDIPIGEMNYRNKGNGIAEIGIKICDFSKQDKGYGTKLLSMLIYSLFYDSGYRKIILDTNINNRRASHVYEKLGFRKSGVRIDSWKNQLGELQSSVDYEIDMADFKDANMKI
ncbi:MAG: GNAT family N-acetyltransferase [Clostridia bacterium]|nr:GNAT family N-acetyltransferase [Clostridia bacterium]